MTRSIPTLTEEDRTRVFNEVRRDFDVPEPQRVEVEGYTDYDGEDALMLTLMFPETVEVDSSLWKRVSPLVERFRSLVRERDPLDRFVYFDVRLKSEDANLADWMNELPA